MTKKEVPQHARSALQRMQKGTDKGPALRAPAVADHLFAAQLTLMKLAAATDERIEPRAFTPESFNPNNPLASEIQDNGVRVA